LIYKKDLINRTNNKNKYKIEAIHQLFDAAGTSSVQEYDEDYNLVKATIAMALSLPLASVAESVEMREQLNLLKEWSCD
jgi:EAL domain-containing protein (putative c-di-GMP-specific phosphodiesterase class I)